MDSLSFQPIMPPLLGLIAVAALAAMLLVGPSFVQLSTRQRGILTLVRGLAIGLVALTIFRPGCISTTERAESALLLCLLDTSRSMELPHQSDQSERWKAMKRMLIDNQPRFQALREKQIEVRFFGFDNDLRPLELDNALPKLPALPEGSETDLGSAIYESVRGLRDQRLVGMLLATDGVQNSLETKTELNDAISTLVDQEIPLYSIPFGLPADVGQVADVAITNLADQHAIFVKNRLAVKATLAARGVTNQQITVQLLLSSREEPEPKVVATEFITPTQAYEERPIELSFIPENPGRFRLTVRAVPLPSEVALRNNELPSFLTVYDGGLRVAYLEGNLGWEQSYLRRTIPTAAQGIDLEFIPIYSSGRNSWPRTDLKDLFADPKVDVFIIGDLDSRALFKANEQEESLKSLEQQIAGGKGLLMLGGYHSFGPGLYQQTPLADVLPITMAPGERQDFDREIRKDLHIERPLRLRPTKEHFLTRLDESPDSRLKWNSLPPLVGANSFQGVKESAEVLLEGDNGQPLLVAGNYGGGRVLAFAGDSSWRWWTYGYEEEYKRFWRQVLLWLAFRDGRSNDNVWIDLPQRRYQPQGQLVFTTGARDTAGQPIADAELTATLLAPDGSSQPVSLTRTPENSRAQLPREAIARPGIYSLRVEGKKGGEKLGQSEVEFVVFDQDREKATPAADPQLLARMADQTKEFGGKALVPEELGGLLDQLLANPPEMKTTVPKRWQLGSTSLDGSLFLLLFAGLMTTEWALRKKWGLV
ncbi:MAG: glutamine amidotransferase [Planctomycetota bacterium]|jgi:uncharacterized membrane protein